MTLFDRVKKLEEERELIIEEFEGVIGIRESVVQIYDVDSFFRYSSRGILFGGTVEIKKRDSKQFPWKADFSIDGIEYLILMDDEEKAKLEKLINELKANVFIDSLGAL